MDKIWIILEREYLQRVKKKSFILSTILTPLIFPIFIAITVFVLSTEESEERVIALLDSNNFIDYFVYIAGDLHSHTKNT